jgi:hypothetical protein
MSVEIKKETGKTHSPKTEEGTIADLFLSEEYQKNFEVKTIIEKEKEWNIDCHEKAEKVPIELVEKKYKQNGYIAKTEVISFPQRGKPVYLHFYRRKWKDLESEKIYTNSYELHPSGMKATAEFGAFLKGLTRSERRDFYRIYQNLRLGRE